MSLKFRDLNEERKRLWEEVNKKKVLYEEVKKEFDEGRRFESLREEYEKKVAIVQQVKKKKGRMKRMLEKLRAHSPLAVRFESVEFTGKTVSFNVLVPDRTISNQFHEHLNQSVDFTSVESSFIGEAKDGLRFAFKVSPADDRRN
ncbi:hypothetical protein ACFLU6_09325 [Acidobacteriota bacterium]